MASQVSPRLSFSTFWIVVSPAANPARCRDMTGKGETASSQNNPTTRSAGFAGLQPTWDRDCVVKFHFLLCAWRGRTGEDDRPLRFEAHQVVLLHPDHIFHTRDRAGDGFK
eukprot:453416-Rhodomonas_salina.2